MAEADEQTADYNRKWRFQCDEVFGAKQPARFFGSTHKFVTACVWLSTVVAIMSPYAHRAMHGGFATYSLGIELILWPIITVAAIWIAMLAGATVRRLRDGGRSSLWAALSLPFLAMGFTLTSALFDAVGRSLSPPMMAFYGLLVNNILFLCALLILACFSPCRLVAAVRVLASSPPSAITTNFTAARTGCVRLGA